MYLEFSGLSRFYFVIIVDPLFVGDNCESITPSSSLTLTFQNLSSLDERTRIDLKGNFSAHSYSGPIVLFLRRAFSRTLFTNLEISLCLEYASHLWRETANLLTWMQFLKRNYQTNSWPDPYLLPWLAGPSKKCLFPMLQILSVYFPKVCFAGSELDLLILWLLKNSPTAFLFSKPFKTLVHIHLLHSFPWIVTSFRPIGAAFSKKKLKEFSCLRIRVDRGIIL